MNKSESIIELAKALSKFQGEVKQPKKNGKNPHFKSSFATLDDVVKSITETAHKHGLSFMQFPVNEDDKVGVKTIVLHDSGEFIEGETIYTRPMKNDPQALGSVVSYLKRYSLSAIFGIVSDEDDDSEGAMQRTPQQQYQPRQQQAPQQHSTTNTNTISDAQIKMIGTLIGKVEKMSGMEKSMIVEVVKNKLKIPLEASTKDLTKGQASGFINELQEMEKVYEG